MLSGAPESLEMTQTAVSSEVAKLGVGVKVSQGLCRLGDRQWVQLTRPRGLQASVAYVSTLNSTGPAVQWEDLPRCREGCRPPGYGQNYKAWFASMSPTPSLSIRCCFVPHHPIS